MIFIAKFYLTLIFLQKPVFSQQIVKDLLAEAYSLSVDPMFDNDECWLPLKRALGDLLTSLDKTEKHMRLKASAQAERRSSDGDSAIGK